MQGPHNLRMPLSCRNRTMYDCTRTYRNPYSFKAMRSSQRVNKNCMTEVAQQFFNVLKEEQEIAQNKHFMGLMVRKNVWPKGGRKSQSEPKGKLHNLSDYLVNCIKHKHTVGNRFKPTNETQNISDILKKDKRLLQIKADIEELHRQISQQTEEVNVSFTSPVCSYLQPLRQQTSASLPRIIQKHIQLSPVVTPTAVRTAVRQSPPNLPHRKQKPQTYTRQYFISRRKQKNRSVKGMQVGPWQISD